MNVMFNDQYVQRMLYFEYYIHWSSATRYHVKARQITPELAGTGRTSAVGHRVMLPIEVDDTTGDVVDKLRQLVSTHVVDRNIDNASCTGLVLLSPADKHLKVEVMDNGNS